MLRECMYIRVVLRARARIGEATPTGFSAHNGFNPCACKGGGGCGRTRSKCHMTTRIPQPHTRVNN